MLALLTILSEEMQDLSPCQKRIFMDKLQEGHVPEYLEQLIREAGVAARSYRPRTPGKRMTNENRRGNVDGSN